MKVAVIGEGYLARTTRECLVRMRHEVVGISDADLVWFAEDTPVDENDVADVESIASGIRELFPRFQSGQTILISSQIPVETTHRVSTAYSVLASKRVYFAYSPENIRRDHGVEDFMKPSRIVVGYRDDEAREAILELFAPIPAPILWTTPESAEMSKHALNAYLAVNIAFANEIAALCAAVGADYKDVERALRSDTRVGGNAYLRAGEGFTGGTLGRDLMYLLRAAGTPEAVLNGAPEEEWPEITEEQVALPLISSIGMSNELGIYRYELENHLKDFPS